MSQVIVNVPPAAFYFALNYNRRRRPLVGENCNTAEECMILMAKAFHAKEFFGSVTHAERLRWFLEGDCKFRCAVDGADKRGGYMILSGNLIALHHVDHGHGDWLLRDAIDHGASRLECFQHSHLIDLYQRHGFQVTGRSANWVAGQPDILTMEYHK